MYRDDPHRSRSLKEPAGRARRRIDVLERSLIGVALISSTLGAFVAFTGWRIESIAWGAGPAGMFAPTAEQRGERLYNVYCSTCHGGPEVVGGRADTLTYPPRHDASGHTWQHPDCELLSIVRNGGDDMTRALRASQARPGAVEMPAFKERLSDDDIGAVLAYIKTLLTQEERQFQEQVSRTSCRVG